MYKIFLLFIAFSFLILQAAPILKTGQKYSFDVDGRMDSTIKDDGHYQKGIERSYAYENFTLIDGATGLEWQDTAVSSMNWEDAQEHCLTLFMNYESDWRLPSMQELLTIVDYSETDPTTADNIFHDSSSAYFWTSTSSEYNSSRAWFISFQTGFSGTYDKTGTWPARCVRGEPLENSNFSIVGETVVDTTTNLQWQDTEVVTTTSRNWEDSIDYCENLILESKEDWRMPNINELVSILDYSENLPAINNLFVHTSGLYYWSSTIKDNDASFAQYVYFAYGYSGRTVSKSDNEYTRCVRGGEAGSVNPAVITYLLDD